MRLHSRDRPNYQDHEPATPFAFSLADLELPFSQEELASYGERCKLGITK